MLKSPLGVRTDELDPIHAALGPRDQTKAQALACGIDRNTPLSSPSG